LALALDRQGADGVIAATQRDADEAAVGRPAGALVNPRIVDLVVDADRVVVLDDPGRKLDLAGGPGPKVLRRIVAAGDDGDEVPRGLINELDQDVVRADQLA